MASAKKDDFFVCFLVFILDHSIPWSCHCQLKHRSGFSSQKWSFTLPTNYVDRDKIEWEKQLHETKCGVSCLFVHTFVCLFVCFFLITVPGGGTPKSTTQDVPRERPPFFELACTRWPPIWKLLTTYYSMTPVLKCSILIDPFLFQRHVPIMTPFLFQRHVPNDHPFYFKVIVKKTTLKFMFNWT